MPRTPPADQWRALVDQRTSPASALRIRPWCNYSACSSSAERCKRIRRERYVSVPRALGAITGSCKWGGDLPNTGYGRTGITQWRDQSLWSKAWTYALLALLLLISDGSVPNWLGEAHPAASGSSAMASLCSAFS